jgi:peptidoglycan hydrolase-like protein with peptidoglycan-binding domain
VKNKIASLSMALILSQLFYAPVVKADPLANEEIQKGLTEIGRNLGQFLQGLASGHGVQQTPGDVTSGISEPPYRATSGNSALVEEIQYRLSISGYTPGSVNGLVNKKTESAIRAYQRSKGVPVDGKVSKKLLYMLRNVNPAGNQNNDAQTLASSASTALIQRSTSTVKTSPTNYLDAMVAEQNALVESMTRNVSPRDREIARRAGIDLDAEIAKQTRAHEKYKRDAARIDHLEQTGAVERVTSLSRVDAKTSDGSTGSASGISLPGILSGRWEGRVSYDPHRIFPGAPTQYGQTTRVRLDIDAARGIAAITYPDLGCEGILRADVDSLNVKKVFRSNPHEVSDFPFKEFSAHSAKQCPDRGNVYLTHLSALSTVKSPRKGAMWFTWKNSQTGQGGMFGTQIKPVLDVVDHRRISSLSDKVVEIKSSSNDERNDILQNEIDINYGEPDPEPYCGSGKLQKLAIPEYVCFSKEVPVLRKFQPASKLVGVPYAVCAVGALVGYKPVYFGVACAGHDRCYSDAMKTKNECDGDFLKLLKTTCDEALSDKKFSAAKDACHRTANMYFGAVQSMGHDAYKSAKFPEVK